MGEEKLIVTEETINGSDELKLIDFDDYLAEQLKDPKFKEAYDKAKALMELIFKSTKSGKRAWILDQILQEAEHLDPHYVIPLPMKKLYNLAKQLKINWRWD